ncbi:MAG: cytochrome c [Nitrospiraceae bacterium]|nr:MAG: cytochrome c [Nitrospiraceae bacterium]
MIILLMVSGLLTLIMIAGRIIPAEETAPGETPGSSAVTVRTDEESIARGKVMFEKVCAKCHDIYGTAVLTGPGLKGVLRGNALPTSGKAATAENILEQLNNPFNKMPSFFFLATDDKLNIIAYLNTL